MTLFRGDHIRRAIWRISGPQSRAHLESSCATRGIFRLAVPSSSTALPKAATAFRTMSSTHTLTLDNINPHVKAAKYAVRGELAARSEKYRTMLSQGDTSLPFDQVISANIGNPQQLDQKPITFFRQVLSILEYPDLLKNAEALRSAFGYQEDVIARAQWLLREVHSVGAYSQSQGATGIRESVAKFIERRDGHSADPGQIFLSAGASAGVMTLLTMIRSVPETGVLVPIPQYPLYTATLAVLDGRCVPYYLDESKAWGTDIGAIQDALQKARADGTTVKALVVINPGNPTGASLPEEDIHHIIKLAAKEKLVLMADEVYQTNVFLGTFTSFKKGLRDLQATSSAYDHVELASLHSISKGMVGECGHRGGYFELVGFDEEVTAQITKLVSISLCSPVIGQCLVELMVNPPAEGQPSYALYKQEYDAIFRGLHERATALYEAFQKMEGVECQTPQGSMYLFPTIHVSRKAVEQAKRENRQPDEFYASRLLDATGVCIVPGSGFGQKEGTLHFRTTFLAPGTGWTQRIVKFHQSFMDEFRD